ncbi:hypothetical protein KIW84_022548 [Lathyrus oleraceus]|uniref:Uncharacterized protein n=1 Tax=Pisum sativum TaxID=3888 RepID=A0A9D4YAR4_PEA|nr:hypothetical protein KIW84_022548 [Pisum sativum]
MATSSSSFHDSNRKVGVPEFTHGRIMNTTRPLDAGWIEEHPRRKTPIKEGTKTQERPADPTGSSRSDWIQQTSALDFYVHIGLPGRYLTHQVDTWGAAQRFRDRFLRDPLTPFYSRY